ncbi:MAG: hypothetical protein GY804_11485 [Alphaproteobacteria bacterium]|nr:hypothetical protein [Alphaproteobacteria bacterium]
MSEKEKIFKWAYRLLLALAIRNLEDANISRGDENNWPAGQKWHQLVGSSHGVFFRKAREEAGIFEHAEFLEYIRSGKVNVNDIYDEAIEWSMEESEGSET